MKRNKQIFIYAVMMFLLSCTKFVEVDPPTTRAEQSTVFSNDQIATSAMVGLYTGIMNSNTTWFNGATTMFPGLSADELATASPSSIQDAFRNNVLTNDNLYVAALWTAAYKYVYHANAIIEGLNASTAVTQATKNQLLGEALFIRALNYFYLVNLFGDVPLVLNTDYEANASIPRAPIVQVYASIVADLLEAKSKLSNIYTVTTAFPIARVRPNKWTATALLSRTYLYLKDWNNAELQSSEIITSGMYRLADNLDNVFLANSAEAIWQMMPVNGVTNTSEGSLFNPVFAAAVPTYVLTPGMVNAFSANDARKSKWTKTSVLISGTYVYPYKYKVRIGGAPYTEYNTVLRYAELFLIRAEARVQQNKLTTAISDLDSIRLRAGLPVLPMNLPKENILDTVAKERRIELYAEWGHRWFDLKRTGKADPLLSQLKGSNWQATDTLYPIYFREIEKNRALKQNPGYFN